MPRLARLAQEDGNHRPARTEHAGQVCDPSDDADPKEPPEELPKGSVGELYVKGPNVFHRCYKHPMATAEYSSPDGWFRTGDVGFMDQEGCLTITDRVKELIKYKGFQVAPAELEGLLVSHELVVDSAVIDLQLKGQGTEGPRAYIAPRGGPPSSATGSRSSDCRLASDQGSRL